MTRTWNSTDTNRTAEILTAEQAEAAGIKVADDEFVMDLRFWDGASSFFIIGRFTGRTRRFWNETCRTIETFDVDTVAVETGDTFALWGVRGSRRTGTWACR